MLSHREWKGLSLPAGSAQLCNPNSPHCQSDKHDLLGKRGLTKTKTWERDRSYPQSKAQHERVPTFSVYKNTQILTQTHWQLLSLSGLYHSQLTKHSNFPYRAPRPCSPSSPARAAQSWAWGPNSLSGLTHLHTLLPFAIAIAPYKNQTFSDCT